MLLAALVAFGGSLVAFAGVTALLRGWFATREGYLLACAVTLVCLSAGLGSATIMLALDFHPVLFRVYEAGIGLLAMVWLTLSVVELVTRSVPVAFAARLFVASISIVAGVILSVDPLRSVTDDVTLPSAEQLYFGLPLTLLAVAHASVVLIISASFIAVAVRAWRGEETTGEIFLSCLLILLAALLVFVAIRPELVSLPTVADMTLLTAASVLIWVAAVRATRVLGQPSDTDEWGKERQEEETFWSQTAGSRSEAPEPPDTRAEPAPSAPSAHQASLAEQRPATGTPSAEHQTTRLSGQAQAASASSMADACGFIVIFTLREGAARPFDRLAGTAVEAIRQKEPGTLLYACHTVADAPQQRIFYELYRDREAMQEHERQPHMRRFIAEREEYVLATNVVRLKLNNHTGLPEPQLSG